MSARYLGDRLHRYGWAGHVLREKYAPTCVILYCSCGWRHTESRQQNAMARAARINAASGRHYEATKPRGEDHASTSPAGA